MLSIYYKMKIYYLTDGAGWIVDRITDTLAQYMRGRGHEVIVNSYSSVNPSTFQGIAECSDIVHYTNSDVARLYNELNAVTKPLIVSIRSFRYPEIVKSVNCEKFLVVNKDLIKDFPGSECITDGVYEYEEKPFKVGMAFYDTPSNWDYKGGNIVKQACDRLDVEFCFAKGLDGEQMRKWYQEMDLIVVASEQEGFNTIVAEAMSLNRPVISTDCGIARDLGVTIVERSVEGIAAGIRKYYTRDRVFPKYSWDNIGEQHLSLYERVINAK